MLDEEIIAFQYLLLDWYDKNKRNFPWRYTFEPYRVLVSEMLLQQTNVEKVIQPYLKIIKAYKDINELSDSDIKFLKSIFKDIGLFYRADRLKDIAKEIVKCHKGSIPNQWEDLIKIKGIGYYICSAILCFGFNQPYAVLDTNVIRIFERIFEIKSEKKRPRDDTKLWEFAQMLIPEDRYVDYNYAVLDFGASICTAYNPKCSTCVFKDMCSSK
ncbi:A/G-specific adenine glycosylase [Clostridium peptidivorans]|uniref:A/G-specific adenine glycosylase n=1 Tax=Clostridium peptidivorans TaxID=100174 RepID=UPI000BE49053|nr:A/G-specific adenine glycosylase [Clostridium peptidivorans]